MLKLAVIFLLVALVAGFLGLGGISHFAMGASKFFFSIFGLVALLCIVGVVLVIRHFARG